jgi:hypothetical protein
MSLHGLLPRVGVQTWPGPFVTWIDNNAHAFSCTDEVYPKPPLNSASLHLESPSATVIITNNAMQFMFLSVTPSLDICVFQIQCLMLQCSSSPMLARLPFRLLFPVLVCETGLDASLYTYSPSRYWAPVVKVLRFLRWVYFCSNRYNSSSEVLLAVVEGLCFGGAYSLGASLRDPWWVKC